MKRSFSQKVPTRRIFNKSLLTVLGLALFLGVFSIIFALKSCDKINELIDKPNVTVLESNVQLEHGDLRIASGNYSFCKSATLWIFFRDNDKLDQTVSVVKGQIITVGKYTIEVMGILTTAVALKILP